jgi:hypothetical protein
MNSMKYFKKSGWATLVVLAMLSLRALVPAGFMVAPVHEHLAFVLCHGTFPASEPARSHAASNHGGSPLHDGMHGDPDCPYAQSAGPAPLPTLPAIADHALATRVPSRIKPTRVCWSCGPARRQFPRGPPSLA